MTEQAVMEPATVAEPGEAALVAGDEALDEALVAEELLAEELLVEEVSIDGMCGVY